MSPPTYDGVDLQDVWSRMLATRSLTQSVEVALSAAATIASSTYAKLLEQSITMAAAESLLIDVSACGSSPSALTADWVYYDVTINGVVLRSVGVVMLLNNSPTGASLCARVPVGTSGLVVGPNVLQTRWRRATGVTTVKIDPSVEGHHAVMRLARVQA